MRYKIHFFRRYGEPKLKKPKILLGIQQAFSVDYIPGIATFLRRISIKNDL